jgi:hypothetical protein
VLVIELANFTLVAYHPVIELEDSQNWAQFSVANQDFVLGDYNGTEDWPWHGILPFIWKTREKADYSTFSVSNASHIYWGIPRN